VERINAFNRWLAKLCTEVVGTMWCAYAFAMLALISLPDAIKAGTAALVAWTAQTFLQLVLLSIIMVGQAVISEKTEKRAEEDHEAIMDELAEIKDMHKDVHVLVKAISVKVEVEEPES
jgi:hypothetical protein